MATQLGSDQPLKICPYNTAHRVAHTKYASHIVACSKAFQNNDLVQCAFHAGHRIKKEDYIVHLYQCEYNDESILEGVILPRLKMEQSLAQGSVFSKQPKGPPIDDPGDWD